jgi:uncharacterized membrane protein YraQ (UPF0718 family)
LVTAGLVLICTNWQQEPQFIIVTIVFGLIIAVLTTFWFGAIIRNMQHSTYAKLQAKHAKDRERILRKAEREKSKVTSASHQQIERAAKKAQARANFKVGAYFAAAIGAGAIMILSQLATVGMMVLVGSASGLAGYLFRARQDRLSSKNKLLLAKSMQQSRKQIGSKESVSKDIRPETREEQ